MTYEPVSEDMFQSPTGAKLNLHIALPPSAPKGVIIICHGLAEHAGRYREFMAALAEAGFAAYAPDHRGHGSTSVPGTDPRTFARENGAQLVLDDVDAVRREASLRHPDIPVVVFGHSMGGMIAINHAMDHPSDLAGLIVANSDLRGGALILAARAILAWERFRKGSDAADTIIKSITIDAWNRQVGDGRTEADWLSRDRQKVDEFVADPQCGWSPTVSMWRDIFRFIEGGADDRRLARLPADLPVLLIGGGKDPATRNAKATRELHQRMIRRGMTDVTVRINEADRHETLNELDRDEAIADIISWSNARVTEA